MLLKRIKRKAILTYRQQEEYWLGSQIIKNSPHAAPDFMIIGTVKSGTTSLFQYLAKHPDITPSNKKELLYFSVKQKYGLRWYLRNFPLKEEIDGCLAFEGSPSYVYYKHGLKRIKRLFPHIKLIIVLRNPVRRAFSQYNFNRDSLFLIDHPNAKEERTFKKAVQDELSSHSPVHPYFQYINRSLYAKHLNNLYEIFSREQFLILDFQDLKSEPKKLLNKVADFLNISSGFNEFNRSEEKKEGLLQTKDVDNNKNLKIYNSNKYKEELDKETEKFLVDYFTPHDEELKKLTGKNFSWMD